MVTEAYPPKAEWVPTDMPDLTGQVVIVTGGNSGVGKEMVKVSFIELPLLHLMLSYKGSPFPQRESLYRLSFSETGYGGHYRTQGGDWEGSAVLGDGPCRS